MKSIAILLSPRAKSAYFNDYLEVAKAELAWVLGSEDFSHHSIGEMDFFHLETDEGKINKLARMSVVYGIFERLEGSLVPLEIGSNFALHEDFIYGSKFKGKTNETLTQLLLNIGLASIKYKSLKEVKLLDPMCGKGTTLLWALNFGCQATGIEQDEMVIPEVKQIIKKWTKIHGQKHQLKEGSIAAKAAKKGNEKFLDFSVNNTNLRVICGDSTEATRLLKKEKFNLLITDLPYGIQHFTTAKTRNPIEVLKACAAEWTASLKPNGVMVLSFNNYLPKRADLIEAFSGQGLEVLNFTAPHRMSESIVRDILVMQKTDK